MNVLLLQLDGKMPNIALMRIAAHHRMFGDQVELRHARTVEKVERQFGDDFDHVYASAIFDRTWPVAERVRRVYPDALLGGTGWDVGIKLEDVGIVTRAQDYSDYPKWTQSIGFSQRGCHLKCRFCVVPRKEGGVTEESTISGLWRGEPWPPHFILLDNDFFGQSSWPARIEELRAMKAKVSLSQGINARELTDERAAALASVDYRADNMKDRRIYCAWDNSRDEGPLFRGLELLAKHGVKPDNITVYMLCGFYPWDTAEDREARRHKLREFGCRPYPMPFRMTDELRGFQRWVIGAYDKEADRNHIPWDAWARNGFRPEGAMQHDDDLPLFPEEGDGT